MGNRSSIIDPTSDEALYGYVLPDTSNTDGVVVDTGVPVSNTLFNNPDLAHADMINGINKDYGFTYNPEQATTIQENRWLNKDFGGYGINPQEAYQNGGYSSTDNLSSSTPSPTPKTDWAKNLQAGASVIGATAGIANAYLGFKNYGLAKKQYAFQKKITNRNLANQALLINEQLDRRARVGNALAGNTLTAEEKAARLDRAARNHVDGSSI